ncbi:hypothetical protein VdG1_00157 [Verticillium dahliae VDG1]|nr:hypothetical protein VdG1_00157 [Verticillium dahliae VDG1]
MTRIQPSQWNFDIDRFINPFVPHPPWRHLPTPVSRFFGYRKTKPDNTGNLVLILWAFIGIFCGIAVIELVSDHVPSFRHHGAPIIVGSFGAAAPGVPDHNDLEAQSTRTSQTTEVGGSDDGRDFELILRPGEVIVPEHMYITPEEKMWLENLSNRL